jgi:hypothetical protein
LGFMLRFPCLLQELYSHYTQQVKDTCASLADPHKAYLLRKAMHYFNTQRQHRQEAHDKPLIEVRECEGSVHSGLYDSIVHAVKAVMLPAGASCSTVLQVPLVH